MVIELPLQSTCSTCRLTRLGLVLAAPQAGAKPQHIHSQCWGRGLLQGSACLMLRQPAMQHSVQFCLQPEAAAPGQRQCYESLPFQPSSWYAHPLTAMHSPAHRQHQL